MIAEVGGFLWREEQITNIGAGFGFKAAADTDFLVAHEKDLVGRAFGHGPMQRDLVAGALGSEVGDRLGQFETGRLRRGDHAASGQQQ